MVVEALTATLVGRVPTKLNPLGRLRLLRLSVATPVFLIVKVLVRVLPTVVSPKSMALVLSSAISTVPLRTSISGVGMVLRGASYAPISVPTMPLPSPSWGIVLVMLLKALEPVSIAGLPSLSRKSPFAASTNNGSLFKIFPDPGTTNAPL